MKVSSLFRSVLLSATLVVALSPGWAVGNDDLPDAKLIRYRLEATNLDFSILKDFHGQSPTLKLEMPTAAADPTASIKLAADRLEPFFPVIPPYVGLGAKKFTAKIWMGSITGVQSVRIVFDRSADKVMSLPVVLSDLKLDEWNALEFSDPALGTVDLPLTNVILEVTLDPDAKAEIYLAAPQVHTDRDFAYSLLTTEMPLMTTGMTEPLKKTGERPLPQRDILFLGGYPIEEPYWFNDVGVMSEFLQKHFPDADLVLAPVWTPHTVVANRLPQLPPNLFFQFQKAQLDTTYLDLIDELPLAAGGKKLPYFGNGILATNPLVQKALKAQVDYAASLGVNNFKQVDYVWPYWDGTWGYDNASTDAFREDLNGKDEGLNLLPGPGGAKAGIIHYWDYFEQYHGFRLSPKDVGLKSWDEYSLEVASQNTDPVQQRKLSGIYAALFHYEWLRQAQRFGVWAKEYGGTHEYTLNGEDINNGGDYVYMARLADVGTLFIECFGSPGQLQFGYTGLEVYTHAAKVAGRKLGLITEIGMGGHGQGYFDPEIGYLFAYELAALGLRDYHNEWMEAPFTVMNDPKNGYLFDRWASWLTQAFGFRRAIREGTYRPTSRVMSVALRSSIYHAPFDMDLLSSMLANAYVDVQQTDPLSLPDYLDKTDVIFYTAMASRPDMGPKLREWLAKGGKSLVTHSYIPLVEDYGQSALGDGAEWASGGKGPFPEYSLLPQFSNLRLDPVKGWTLAKTASKLLETGSGQTLLSKMPQPNGSAIYYIHARPKDLNPQDRDALMAKLIEEIKLPRLAIGDPALGDGCLVHRYKNDKAEVVSIWNREELNLRTFGGGYGPHLLPGRGGDTWDPKVRPYPLPIEGARCGVKLPVAAAGVYRVYRFFADKEETVTVGPDKLLTLAVDGALAEQFYFAPEGGAIQSEIADVRKFRSEVLPYFPTITAK